MTTAPSIDSNPAPVAGPIKRQLSLGGTVLELLTGGSGPPLVFLHGEEGPRGWQAHHAALAGHFTVYAPVMPGCGGSGRPDWVESVPALAKYYLWAQDVLAPDSLPLLAGASLGGWIAAEMATMAPERFSRLALIGAQGVKTLELGAPDLFAMPYRRYMRLSCAEPEGAHARAVWRDDASDTDLDTDIEIMEMAARLGFKPYMHDRTLLPALARVRQPALLLWGEHDRATPAAVSGAFLDALPAGERIVVPRCGHFAHLEQPLAIATHIAAFAWSSTRLLGER
ncbi:MAG: alpha/beta hydrolase [Rhodospirillaceae bacterium]|nr:alpha/beta hydrolase [Rhodospirillaceae bacterium]